MKRELLIHFIFWVSIFILITLFKHYFNFGYWPFYVGGLLGVVLPDLDHFLYVYLIRPDDLSSQRINYMVNKKEILKGIEYLYDTRIERRNLIFHSIFFQGIFFIVLFWVLSSSGSLLGRGLALSFMIHLCVDQLIDIKDFGSLNNWYTNLPFRLDFNQAKMYWIASSAIILLMGFLM